MVSEIIRFYCKPDMTSSWFVRQGALHTILWWPILTGRLWFILVLHWNYTSIMHRFCFNELFMFAGNDVIAILSLGGASGNFWLRILKGRPDFILIFNWHFLSTLNGLDVIRLFLFGWDFPTGSEMFWGKMTPKTSNERKILAGRALPYAKLRLLSHCVWNYLYSFGPWRCARTK